MPTRASGRRADQETESGGEGPMRQGAPAVGRRASGTSGGCALAEPCLRSPGRRHPGARVRARPYGGVLPVTDSFIDALLASPVGVTLLARLETRAMRPEGRALVLDSTPDSVAAAVEAVERMSFGELVEVAVLVGMLDVGPWAPQAADTAAAGYRHAHARAPIAESLDDRFATALHEPIGRQAQQWWTTRDLRVDRLAPLFRDYEQVYGQASSPGRGCGR